MMHLSFFIWKPLGLVLNWWIGSLNQPHVTESFWTEVPFFLSCSSLQLFVLARAGLSPDSPGLKSCPPTHVSLSIHLIFNGSIIIFSFALARTILRRRRDRNSHLPVVTEQTIFIQTVGGKHFEEFAKNCFSLSNSPDLKWTQIWSVISSLNQKDPMKTHKLRQRVLCMVVVDWRMDNAGCVLWLCLGQPWPWGQDPIHIIILLLPFPPSSSWTASHLF